MKNRGFLHGALGAPQKSFTLRSSHQQIQGGFHWCDPLRRSHCGGPIRVGPVDPSGSQPPASSAPRRRSWIGRPSCSTKQPLGGTWLDDVRWLVKVEPDAIWIRCKTLRGNPIGLLGWNNWICSCCLTYGGIWNDIRQKGLCECLMLCWCYCIDWQCFWDMFSTKKGSWVVRTNTPSNKLSFHGENSRAWELDGWC